MSNINNLKFQRNIIMQNTQKQDIIRRDAIFPFNRGKMAINTKQYCNVKGITIIELLVVIFIIGVFLSFFIPRVTSRIGNNARVSATRQEMEQIRKAIVGNPDLVSGGELTDVGFKGDIGRLPRHLIELATRRPDTTLFNYPNKESLPIWDPWTKRGWKGPYMRDDGQQGFMKDAWGEFYEFLIDPAGDTIGLKSPGIDGEWDAPGTVGDDIKVLF